MINTLSNVVYKVFGLNVESEIHLPELIQINGKEDRVDVQVVIENSTQLWSGFQRNFGDFVVQENFVMFQIPNIATFAISDGNKISISPMSGSKEGEIRLFILGTCMGVILQQRRILPLHGSAIEIGGKAYAFVGNSGAGKSTLASSFIKKGYRLLTDDIIALSLSQEGNPFVTPSYPQQKLWQESLDELDMKNHDYLPLFERETKYAVPVTFYFFSGAIPLGGIFELVPDNSERIEVSPIKGLERLHKLFYHTYRNFMIYPSGLMNWHLNISTSIADKLQFFQIRRPVSRFTAQELTTIILETIEN